MEDVAIRLRGIGRTFVTATGRIAAVAELDLDVPAASFTTLLGASGCGKTTTLRMVAGLERPDAGSVVLGERAVFDADARIDVPPHRRGIGMVFQSFAVWPHLSVVDNVAYPLRTAGTPRREARRESERTLELVGLAGLGRRRPSQLSGGQQQRVAIARALVHRPEVLLLDEPFSALDGAIRSQFGQEVRALQRELGITVLYVTHDRREALVLSDRIAVLDRGRLVQSGSPRDLYDRPASRLVAETLGSTNLLRCSGVVRAAPDGSLVVDTEVGELRCRGRASVGPPNDAEGWLVNVRVEDVRLLDDRTIPGGASSFDGTDNSVTGCVVRTTYRGPNVDVDVAVGAGVLRARTTLRPEPTVGDEVTLAFPVDRTSLVPDDGTDAGTDAGTGAGTDAGTGAGTDEGSG